MANVVLSGVQKAFGEVQVLRDIDLEVRDGEFMVFVGPSGCGKSTLLRTIAGLEDITGGTLSIGGRVVNEVPPAERGIAMVFQSYALYPHMDLYENMAFGLKLAKVPRAEVDAAVRNAAKILHIEHLLQRKPKDLSGGQRQRVAIGRAIVRKPEVFLFDEPLSNLDAALRMSMRVEFTKLHEELKTTMIYVTHDQVEAMTLADRIVVLQAGRIEQVGAPLDLYEHPCNRFVAGFIGSPRMNFLQATLVSADAAQALVELADGSRLRADVDATRAAAGAPVTLGVRPEHLASGAGDNALAARVSFVDHLGGTSYAYFDFPKAELSLTAQLPGHSRLRPGDVATLVAPPAACHLFDAEGRAFARRTDATALAA
ncbi:MAG TPA: sn-glycerol-3-phosphate ABC transporter ATP-binding protein UgpC [Burkholderiaceae bacterium]|nr:sn-glycerol-3-phosphate ABC transporter ATP-binding protein UgpC [Burkholderiaceae bacterium]